MSIITTRLYRQLLNSLDFMQKKSASDFAGTLVFFAILFAESFFYFFHSFCYRQALWTFFFAFFAADAV